MADYTQAIMDFGATLCTRHDPACVLCPLQDDCVARREGLVEQLPEAKPGKPLPERRTLMLLLRDSRGHVLLARRPPTGVWSGLWSLPEAGDHDEARAFVATHAGADFDAAQALPLIEHTFSHYRLHIEPLSWRIAETGAAATDTHRWQPFEHLADVGLPAPVKKLLGSLTP
jgi:A/G-specific adenine glycosylase